MTILEDLTDEVPLEAKQEHPLWPSECVANLTSALDELEALRVAVGPAGDIISGVLTERLAAAEAQRDELLAALELAEVDVAMERTWCRICRTEFRGDARNRATHPHAAGCILASARGEK